MNRKEEEKSFRWGEFFGCSLPRPTHLTNNIKTIKIMEGRITEKTDFSEEEIKEAKVKTDEFIKGFGRDVAEKIWSQVPHNRQGEFLKYVEAIIRDKHEYRIQDCQSVLKGLASEYEEFQVGLNGK